MARNKRTLRLAAVGDSVRMEVIDPNPAIVGDTDNMDVIKYGRIHSVLVAREGMHAATTAQQRVT